MSYVTKHINHSENHSPIYFLRIDSFLLSIFETLHHFCQSLVLQELARFDVNFLLKLFLIISLYGNITC